MDMMNSQKLLALAVAAGTAVTLACGQSPRTPLSPSGTAGVSADANPDGSTLKVTAPVPVAPVGGVVIEDLDPELVIENSKPLFVSSLNLTYVFEVIDEDGQLVHRSNPIAQGAGGRTTYEIPIDLDFNEVHTWRAWAVFAGQRGPFAAFASFKTFEEPRFGISCAHLGEPVAIIACRFDQHNGDSGMDHEETVQFMKEVAFDLNRAIFSDKGGYGLLIKTTGNNCLGYSCDIICEGNGPDQNQFDILQDERIPQWSEVGEGIVVRECEIIK